MSGWIRIDRDIFDHGMFAPEPMSEREAWMWMLANAAWEDTTHRVGGEVLNVPRGSFMVTLRELQSVFMWRSDSRVRGFLKRLEGERMIERTTRGPKNAPKTHVTICKYDEYQDGQRTGNAPGTHRERTDERTKETNINNKQGSSNEDLAREAFDQFAEMAQRCGMTVPEKFSATRKKTILARLKDCDGMDGWVVALRRIEASDFLRQSSWFGLDWIIKAANFTKLLEGNYDNRTSTSNRGNHPRASSPHDSLLAGFAAFANSDDDAEGRDFGGGYGPDDTGGETMDSRSGGYASQPVLRVIGSN